MTPKEFYDTVVVMRKHRLAYSRSSGRDRTALRYAKEAERLIDNEIARVQLLQKERLNPRLDL